MAVVTWLGGTSSDVTTGANWSGAAVPNADDTAIWSSITTYGMSGTFTNAVNLVVTDGAGWGTTTVSRDVGTAASPLVLKSNGANRFGNRGHVYITTSGTVPTVSLEMPNGGTGVISGGTITTLKASSVRIEVGASAVIGTFRCNGVEGTVAANATDVTKIIGSGIRLTLNSRDIDDATIIGASVLTVTGTSAVDGAVVIGPGSVFADQSSGTKAEAEILSGGVYTVAGNNSSAATLTTARIHKGATLIEAVPGFTLTVTTKDYVGGQSYGSLAPPA